VNFQDAKEGFITPVALDKKRLTATELKEKGGHRFREKGAKCGEHYGKGRKLSNGKKVRRKRWRGGSLSCRKGRMYEKKMRGGRGKKSEKVAGKKE